MPCFQGAPVGVGDRLCPLRALQSQSLVSEGPSLTEKVQCLPSEPLGVPIWCLMQSLHPGKPHPPVSVEIFTLPSTHSKHCLRGFPVSWRRHRARLREASHSDGGNTVLDLGHPKSAEKKQTLPLESPCLMGKTSPQQVPLQLGCCPSDR